MTRLRAKASARRANDQASPNAQMTKVQRHYRATPPSFLAVKILRSTHRHGFAMKTARTHGLLENSNANTLWIGKNSSSHLLQPSVSCSCLASFGTGS